MRIVTWNCNGALRKKYEFLAAFNADLLVIQECENPAEAAHGGYKEWAKNYLWVGDNKHKGLEIFAKEEIVLEALDWEDAYQGHQVKYFIPCQVDQSFQLLAVWAHYNNSPNFGYIGQLWKYLQLNKQHLKKAVIAGDFNSNAIWDEWDRWWNYSDVEKELKEVGIESLYHKFYDEIQGQESHPTFFMNRKVARAYHIDYVFACQELTKSLLNVEVGKVDEWLRISDHLPLICHFNNLNHKFTAPCLVH
ncbi:endonuclease/exonuclease/phosphatase family protein [Pontibacter mangrovi]|uniref:Endonuclease/exonuclease/phosphatase family protein n=1 Tax=Pontibacter mangrovi TaxID=2589816 RepID=A0A501W2X9_9BACT|nr:endonuclease/exonuclease/phosphatase family protein [Pontibacter mangrovi]